MRFARELTSRTWCTVFGLLLVPAVAHAQTAQKLTPIVLPIGPPNGSQSDSAIYLNEAGTVVGTILRADGHRDAYSWANGVSVNLVPTTADQNFTPAALKDAGDVAILELDYTADPNHPTSTSLIWHAGSTSQRP